MSISCLDFRKNWWFWVGLFVAFYYQTYRYPFEYGIDPPLPWRVTKYVLLSGICLISLPRFFGQIKKFRFFEWGVLVLFSILGLFGYLQNEKFLVQASFCGLVAFWMAQSCEQVSYRSLLLFLFCAWGVNTAFYLVEAIGLVIFAKPFLWSGSDIFTSRFGGMLVDPLGAPFFSLLFLGLAFEFKGWLRWVIAITSVLTIAMTQTLTAWLFLALFLTVGVGTWAFHRISWRVALMLTILCLIMLVTIAIGFWNFKDTILLFMPGKWDSVLLHAEFWWPKRWPWLPMQDSLFSETWWVFAVQSMGILWTVAYVWLMLVLVQDCARRAKLLIAPQRGKPLSGVFLGIYLSGTFIIFGSFNQLYLGMYPVGLVALLFAFMIKYNKISPRSPIVRV